MTLIILSIIFILFGLLILFAGIVNAEYWAFAGFGTVGIGLIIMLISQTI